MYRALWSAALVFLLCSPAFAQTVNIDNPADGAIVTGADAISGWTCEANILQIRFDGGGLITLPYGGTRGDTIGVCGDDDNGFALAWNWALLGPGQHTIQILKNGTVEDTRTVTVIGTGQEFLSSDDFCFLRDFPGSDDIAMSQWSNATQNTRLVTVNASPPLDTLLGTWELTFFILGLQFDRIVTLNDLTLVSGIETVLGADGLGGGYAVVRFEDFSTTDFPYDLIALRVTSSTCRAFFFNQSSSKRWDGIGINAGGASCDNFSSLIDAMFAVQSNPGLTQLQKYNPIEFPGGAFQAAVEHVRSVIATP